MVAVSISFRLQAPNITSFPVNDHSSARSTDVHVPYLHVMFFFDSPHFWTQIVVCWLSIPLYTYIYIHTQLHSHKIPDPIEIATLGPPFLRTQPSKSIQIHPTPRWEEFSEWFRQSERWTIGACEVFHYFVVKRRRYNCSAAMSYGTWFVAWLEGEMLAIQLLL